MESNQKYFSGVDPVNEEVKSVVIIKCRNRTFYLVHKDYKDKFKEYLEVVKKYYNT